MTENKRKANGRPTKYRPEYCQAIIDYFTVKKMLDKKGKPIAPPYFQNFCTSIGISKQCLSEWVLKFPNFGDAYKVAKSLQKQLMVTLALQGHYNASFTWRAMMNMHGWRDEKQVDVSGGLKIEMVDKFIENTTDEE